MTERENCQHCGEPVYWDDWCYVHENGIANCNAVVRGGEPIISQGETIAIVNPEISTPARTVAEPQEEPPQ